MSLTSFILTLVFGIQSISAETLCLGPKDSEMQIVYLHGLDVSPKNAAFEKQIRTSLEVFAKELKARIALPQSPQKCRNNIDNCWKPNRNSPKRSRDQLKKALELSSSCFGKEQRPHLIGFSNGGYLAAHAIKYCVNAGFVSYSAFSAGGELDEKKDFSKCPGLNIFVSEDDVNLKASETLFQRAKKLNAQVRLYKYKGSSPMPIEPTLTVLKLLKKSTMKSK